MKDDIAIDDTIETTSEHARLLSEIRMYEKEAEDWITRGKRILKRYKDKRSSREDSDGKRRYNILYSNVQTLLPAYFSRTPKPDIERRFKDKDDIGRIAAEVWERSVSYFVSKDIFHHSMKQSVMDRLLPGRGVVWVRYIPHMRDIEMIGGNETKNDGYQITDDVSELDSTEPVQEVYNEEVCPDYVNWEDFGHNVARTWEEVWLVWRKVYLTRSELIKRFGEEIGKEITLDYTPKGLSDEKINDDMKKATIYELWDKKDKKAKWLHKDLDDLADSVDDPLGLDEFFPCPRPLYPTMTNDSLIPIPDYAQYQDQAKELDDLTGRIAAITKAIKVAGVYDSSAAGVERLLSEGTENRLIPVSQWAVFGEKGGLKGAMDLLPMQEIMQTLLGLYEAREKVKADLYEITGIADIVRGATKASETATAQNLKGQYAALRLDDGQQAVQRFARDLVRIVAQIIANHFSPETIKAISGMNLLTDQEKQHIQMQQQQQQMLAQQQYQQSVAIAQQSGQPTPPPPKPPAELPEELQEQMLNPSWEQVIALLKDNAMRCFRIDIETDSTLKADQESEKQQRVEFLTAAGGYIQQAAQVAQMQPELTPLLMEMLMFGVRAFPVGKQLETTFELALQKLSKKQDEAENQPPKPSPEEMKAQADIAAQQARTQADAKEAELDAQLKMKAQQQDFAFKKQQMEMDHQLRLQEIQFQHELDTQQRAAEGQKEEKSNSPINLNLSGIDSLLKDAVDKLGNVVESVAQQNAEHAKAIGDNLANLTQSNATIHQHLTKPKRVTVKKPDGSVLTAEVG